MRTEGYPGIRSLYTVDEAALLSLSEDYRVSIGALMAIGDVRSGNTTAFDLAIKADIIVDVNGSTGIGYDEYGIVYLKSGTYTVDLTVKTVGQIVVNSLHAIRIPEVAE